MPSQSVRWSTELEDKNRYNLKLVHKEAKYLKWMTLSLWLLSGLLNESCIDVAKTGWGTIPNWKLPMPSVNEKLPKISRWGICIPIITKKSWNRPQTIICLSKWKPEYMNLQNARQSHFRLLFLISASFFFLLFGLFLYNISNKI